MQETSVDTSGWKAFWARWDGTVKKIPGMKEAMLEAAGRGVRGEVQSQIVRSGVNDARGRVQLWQNRHVGSGLGYVAVRSDSVEVTAGNQGRERLNAGALTNYLTSGHKVRSPSGRSERYKPRIRMTRVRGYDFYKTASAQAEKIALQEAENFLKQLEVTLQ
jgi:hypothetical protein